MRDPVVSLGKRPTPQEMLVEWEQELHERPTAITADEIVRILHEERR